nr:uncharacterized protein LOC111510994 [Leptinotarsa decemlineata]
MSCIRSFPKYSPKHFNYVCFVVVIISIMATSGIAAVRKVDIDTEPVKPINGSASAERTFGTPLSLFGYLRQKWARLSVVSKDTGTDWFKPWKVEEWQKLS